MKTVFSVIAALMLFAAIPATAQHMGGSHEDHEARLEQMKTELNLSDEQVAQIQAIHQEYRTKREGVVNKADRDRLKALRKEEMEKVHGVLTEEQAAKARELHGQHRHDGRGQRHGGY